MCKFLHNFFRGWQNQYLELNSGSLSGYTAKRSSKLGHDGMKHWVKNAILGSGAFRGAGTLNGRSAAILMYHSVLPNPGQESNSLGDIIHSESAFRQQMELLAQDYQPISLDQAVAHVRHGSAFPKRSVVVTFDDGYADNSAFAMPILNRLGIPATFYVTVDCVENRRLPWPTRLRFTFRSTQQFTWTDARGKSWSLTDAAKREEAYLAACDDCCQLSGEIQEEFVRRVEQELHSCLPSAANTLMMTYDQVRTLARNGHIVGSHTMTHPNLAYVKKDDAQRELTESKRHLELELDAPVKHFSYPCPALSPHWSEQTVEQSRAVGYESAVTTNSGLTRSGDNPLCLKRIHPTKTVEGLRWNLESAFAGRKV